MDDENGEDKIDQSTRELNRWNRRRRNGWIKKETGEAGETDGSEKKTGEYT